MKQLDHEGYEEMVRKGGSTAAEMSVQETAKAKGIDINESKYMTK